MSAEDWGHEGFLTENETQAFEQVKSQVQEELGLSGLYLETKCILRFCRARKFHVKKTMKMIAEESKWRKQFDGHRFSISDFPSLLQFSDDGVVKTGGSDKANRPVVYVLPSKYFPSQIESDEELALFFVFYMDSLLRIADRAGREDFTVICDMGGWSFKNFSLPQIKIMVHILQNYYPERLGRVFVTNTPYLFKAAWKLVYPLLDERTRLKIQILDKNTAKIFDSIDINVIDEAFGGKHPSYPTRDAIVGTLFEVDGPASPTGILSQNDTPRKEEDEEAPQQIASLDTPELELRDPTIYRKRSFFRRTFGRSKATGSPTPSPRNSTRAGNAQHVTFSDQAVSKGEFKDLLQKMNELTEKIARLEAASGVGRPKSAPLHLTGIGASSNRKATGTNDNSKKEWIYPALVIIFSVQLWCLQLLLLGNHTRQ